MADYIVTDKRRVELVKIVRDGYIEDIYQYSNPEKEVITNERIKFAMEKLIADKGAKHTFHCIRALHVALKAHGLEVSERAFRQRILCWYELFDKEIYDMITIPVPPLTGPLLSAEYINASQSDKMAVAAPVYWGKPGSKEQRSAKMTAFWDGNTQGRAENGRKSKAHWQKPGAKEQMAESLVQVNESRRVLIREKVRAAVEGMPVEHLSIKRISRIICERDETKTLVCATVAKMLYKGDPILCEMLGPWLDAPETNADTRPPAVVVPIAAAPVSGLPRIAAQINLGINR